MEADEMLVRCCTLDGYAKSLLDLSLVTSTPSQLTWGYRCLYHPVSRLGHRCRFPKAMLFLSRAEVVRCDWV